METLRGVLLLAFAGLLIVLWMVSSSHGIFWLILIGGIALWLGAIFLKVVLRPDDTTLGSARFGSRADVNALATNGGDLLIGRARGGRLLRYDGPAHLLTIAPTRSGKGVGTIIPNLLTADRSIVCIDPKGENARVTMRAREAFGPVHCLDPFGISGRPTARYNPLDRLEADSVDLAEDAMTLADALVFDENEVEAHWNEEARALISGIILYVCCHDEPAHRTLTSVRDYLTLAPDDFTALLAVMQASDGAGGLIARAANRQLSKSHREAAGVLSAAQRHTHFLDSPRIAQVVGGSDFSFADLKDDVATVFLILPPDRLDTYSRWLRLLVAQAINELARSSVKPSRPVLFLLDEFAALGRLQPVERAMGLMAGYGLQLWPILQDIHQLRSIYGTASGTFLSNAGVVQAFGVNDFDTADMLSKTLGRETIAYETDAQSEKDVTLKDRGRTLSKTRHFAARNLMDPNEIMKLKPETLLLMRVGENPLIVRKLRYFADKEFAGMFDNG
ncbi:MAG: type IV secretory system conjugative DNA transfer family protein [Sphingomonadaceae bacterium]|nr:type IV secretory system conjugative DNA transfer family protein [Sphingomonadaceae bacterium]